MTEERLRVLLLDDEEALRVPLKEYLVDSFGYHVDAVASGEEALWQVEEAQGRYDVALIDEVLLDGLDGIQVMGRIKGRYPDIECIIFTGWSMERALEALQAGAYRYLAKPLNLNELGMTIRTAAEHRQLKRQLETTKQEKEWLQTFLEIGKATTSVLDFDRVLEEVHRQIGRLMDVSGLNVVLYDEENQTLHFELCFDRGKQQAKWQRPFTSDKGLTDWVIRNSQPLLVRDYPNDPLPIPAQKHHYGDESDQEVTRSWLGVPLIVRDKVIGAITVQSYEPYQFDETDQQVLTTVASQVAVAIENARLFSTLERTSKHLEGLVVSSFDAVISIDRDKRVTVFSEQAEKMFGYTADEMGGQTVAKLHRDINEARKIWDIIHRQGKVMSHEVTLKHKDGTEIPILLSAVSITDAARNEIGQAGFMHDQRQVHLLEDRLRALIEAGQAIGGILEPDQVLQLVVESAIAAFPTAEKGSIHLYDERTGMLHIRASLGYSQDVVEALILKVGEGFAGWVYEHGAPIVSGNVQVDERFKKLDHPETREQKSAICVPLKIKGEVIGTLSLDNPTTFDAFKPDDIGLLSTFAAQAAIAIDNARLFKEAEDGLARLRSVYEASSQIVSTLDPDQALHSIVEKACQTMDAWRASVLLVDETGRPQRLVAIGFEKDLKADTSIRPEGISREVIRVGASRFIEDTALANRAHPQMIADGVRAAACLPFSLQETTIGVIWIHYREPRHFSEMEKETLRLYATQSAIAYDNARRMRELEHMRKAAEAMAGALLDKRQVLQRIAEGARQVLQADSSAIWSYDNVRNQFIPVELVADGIPRDDLEKFRKSEPKRAGTASTVMDRGWVGVTDVSHPQYAFMGPSTRDLLDNIGAKSFQGITLKVGTENLGVLYVNYNHPRSFTEEDKETLENFANQAALALKKTRLLDQVNKARNAARVVARVSVLEDLRSTLDSIVKGTQEVLNCDAVTLYTYDQARDEFGFPPAMFGVRDTAEVLKLGLITRESVIRGILALEEAHVAEDAPSNPVVGGPFVKREEIKSSVGIPLKVGDRKVGVMFVNYRSRHRFTPDELTNIELFANHAAIAIQNAQLYRQATERLEESMVLQRIALSLTSALELEELLDLVMAAATKLTSTDSGSVLFWDPLTKRFTLTLSTIGPGGKLKPYRSRVRREGGIARTIIDQRKPIVIPDTLQDPRVSPVTIEKGRRALVGAPLLSNKEVIGVLFVKSSEPREFSDRQVRLLEAFASQAAVAIEKARRYEELKQTKGLVGGRTAVAWMGMVSTAWRHAIEGHAITIREQIQLLRSDLSRRISTRDVEERLTTIEGLAGKIMAKPITPPLSAEEGVGSVSINDLVRERINQLWGEEPYKSAHCQLDLSLEESATVRASSEWLKRAFDVLIDNAVEAVAGSAAKQLTVATQPVDGSMKIVVTDTGGGIPDDVLPKLFKEQIKKHKGARGLGIGLLMAQTIAQTYGGEIRVGSTDPRGTTMVIRLPLEA